jgi:LacI family transcriptional regulator
VRAYIREKAHHIPTVILGTETAGFKAPMVMPDNYAAGHLAADHLYGLFHKHYGWFASDTCPSGNQRKQAFEERLREHGFACTDLSCGKEPFNSKTILHKLKHAPKPIGILARDDHDAAVLLDLCQRIGLRTPEEVAVIGVGDLESLCAFSRLPVSSISLNMDELGFHAASVLDQLMHGKPVPEKTVLAPGPLTQRLSTGCLAIVHPHLRMAVNTIDKEFKSLLTMEDLAASAGISRRQLYLLFQNEMRCQIGSGGPCTQGSICVYWRRITSLQRCACCGLSTKDLNSVLSDNGSVR